MPFYDDKKFGAIFPKRSGAAQGGATERTMLDALGGSESFRTRVQRNGDGTETELRTKDGSPQFYTPPRSSKVTACSHGLFFDGEEYLDGSGDMRTRYGMLELPSGAIRDLPGTRPTGGDVHLLGDRYVSGAYARICGVDHGAFVWPATVNGVNYWFKHEPGSTSILVYAEADEALASTIWQLTLPNDINNRLQSLFDQYVAFPSATLMEYTIQFYTPSGYSAAWNLHLVDLSSTGTKLLIEVHLQRSSWPGQGTEAGDIAARNCDRLMRPHTLLLAFEAVIGWGDSNLTLTINDLVNYARRIDAPPFGTIPVVWPSALPVKSYQVQSWNEAVTAGGTSVSVVYYPQSGGSTTTLAIDPASRSYNQLRMDECIVNGVRYKVDDTVEVLYTRTQIRNSVNEVFTKGTVFYYENGPNEIGVAVGTRQELTHWTREYYAGSTKFGPTWEYNRAIDYDVAVIGNGSLPDPWRSDIGTVASDIEAPSEAQWLVRPSGAVFSVLKADIPWHPYLTVPSDQYYVTIKVSTALFQGSAQAKVQSFQVFDGQHRISDGPMYWILPLFLSNPLLYATERPTDGVIAASINKSVCWV